jgi:hypothetical protein
MKHDELNDFEGSSCVLTEIQPGKCLEGLRKATRNRSKCCRCPSLNAKLASPKYKPTAALLHKGRDTSKSQITELAEFNPSNILQNCPT